MNRIICLALLLPTVALLGGCLVAKTVGAVGSVATTAVKTTGKVAATAVTTTGKVAAAAVNAGSDVAGASVRTASRLAQTGAVVFFDPASGLMWRAPWSPGLRLTAARQIAQVGVTWSAVKLIRATREQPLRPAGDVALEGGDVVVVEQVR
ncbi:MAG: hypothetical protein HZA31_09600 [Opitutae bacterium]|nr:hypothetical protein [Opitutae bacterium]